MRMDGEMIDTPGKSWIQRRKWQDPDYTAVIKTDSTVQ